MSGSFHCSFFGQSDQKRKKKTLVIKATQYDNRDRYTVTTLTVTRDGQVGGLKNIIYL